MRTRRTCLVLCTGATALLFLSGCGRADREENSTTSPAPEGGAAVPESLAMGGEKSVLRFFVTSVGLGKGGNLGGLAGADAHC